MMKKRALCLLLAVCLVSCFCAPASASFVVGGSCGTSLKWELDGDTLTISGKGSMTEYTSESYRPWNELGYTMVRHIVIGREVTSLSARAFVFFLNLESVTFEQASSLKTIGDYAFSNCARLTEISLPSTVEKLGEGVFSGCAALESVSLPANLRTIGGGCFSSCPKIAVSVPEASRYFKSDSGVLLSADEKTLYLCPQSSGLLSYTLPAAVTSIGEGAFSNNKTIEKVIMGDNVTSIGESAFAACTALRYVGFGSAVSSIGANAFSGCTALSDLRLPTSLRSIGSQAFWECEKLAAVNIPRGVTSIGSMAFGNCPKLTSAFVPSTVNEIGSQCFDLITIWGEGMIGIDFRPAAGFVLSCEAGSYALRFAEEENIETYTLDTKGALANFVRRYTYNPGRFTDVNEALWYGAEGQGVIVSAYELGIVNGSGEESFSPENDVTLAELIKMAVSIRLLYEGDSRELTATAGTAWYTHFVRRAITEGIIKSGEYADYELAATRAQTAHILAAALPSSELKSTGAVTVPDVASTDEYAADIYALYAAGVLTGDAGTGAFRPDDSISRAEVAAVVARLINPAARR